MKNYLADIDDIFDDNQLEYYIHTVFNYYNGKINPSNPAKLFINWRTSPDNTIPGILAELSSMSYYYPANVVIRPNLLEVNNLFEFKSQIIIGIIHELYHAEQCIDYINDEKHHTESQVIFAVIRYLVNHLDEIKQFGLFMDYKHCVYYYNHHLELGYEDVPYKKMTYRDHINSFVDLCTNNAQFAAETRELINTRSKIIIDVESPIGEIVYSLVICDNNHFVSIEKYNECINRIIYECKRKPERIVSFIVDENESEVHLIIHFENYGCIYPDIIADAIIAS